MKKIFLTFVTFISRVLPAFLKKSIYRIRPLAKLVRNSLNLAVPEGITLVSITAGELAGMQMQLDLQTEKDHWLGTYEPNLLKTIIHLVQPGWVAYDIGANIGYISLLLAQTVGEDGKVFSFEALPTNLDRLRSHIEINGLNSRVDVVPSAVAASSGVIRFFVGPSGAMGKAEGSAGRPESPGESIEVQGISLDDFVYQNDNPPPDVIKMDIEGGEVLALQGMSRLLTKARPLILLELHGPKAARVAWKILTGAGYSLHTMERDLSMINSLDTLDWKAYVVAQP